MVFFLTSSDVKSVTPVIDVSLAISKRGLIFEERNRLIEKSI